MAITRRQFAKRSLTASAALAVPMVVSSRVLGANEEILVGVVGLGTEHVMQERETMAAVLRTAVEAGVNYVDLLYDDPAGAPDFWDNLAPVLQPYRDKLVLAAHWGWGPGHNSDLDGAQRCLDEVLARGPHCLGCRGDPVGAGAGAGGGCAASDRTHAGGGTHPGSDIRYGGR